MKLISLLLMLFLQHNLFSYLILGLLLLFSQFFLMILLELFPLISQFLLQLLGEYALKGLKSCLIDTSRLLNCLNGLLVDSRRSINRGSTDSNSSGRLNSLRRLRFLHLFFDRPLNWSLNLFDRSLLCCALMVILISHWKLVWRRSLRHLLLLLLYGDGRIISRGWSTEVNRLVDKVAYCSNMFVINLVIVNCPSARLPVL